MATWWDQVGGPGEVAKILYERTTVADALEARGTKELEPFVPPVKLGALSLPGSQFSGAGFAFGGQTYGGRKGQNRPASSFTVEAFLKKWSPDQVKDTLAKIDAYLEELEGACANREAESRALLARDLAQAESIEWLRSRLAAEKLTKLP